MRPVRKMRDWDAEKTARDPKTDGGDLETLARSWDWHVRRAVAQNPCAPPTILDELARDKVQWVREAVAGNQNTGPMMLVLLAHDADGFVRATAALSEAAPPDVLEELAHDETVDFDYTRSKNRHITQEAVAKNPRTPAEVVKFLA